MEDQNIIKGNYEYLIDSKRSLLDRLNKGYNLVLIGKTGSGKSRFLESLFDEKEIIDCAKIYLNNDLNKANSVTKILNKINIIKPNKTLIIDGISWLYDHNRKNLKIFKDLISILNNSSKFVITFQDEHDFSLIKPSIEKLLFIIHIVSEVNDSGHFV